MSIFMIRPLATGLLLASSLGASTLSSSDPNITVSSGVVTVVQPVPCTQAQPYPWCYGATPGAWISNQDSGWNGTAKNEPIGSFSFFEPFSVQFASTFTFLLGGDDRAKAYVVTDGVEFFIGTASFTVPKSFSFDVTPGAHVLRVDLFNDHAAASGNYTAASWDGNASPVPEPAMLPIVAVLTIVLITCFALRRKK